MCCISLDCAVVELEEFLVSSLLNEDGFVLVAFFSIVNNDLQGIDLDVDAANRCKI